MSRALLFLALFWLVQPAHIEAAGTNNNSIIPPPRRNVPGRHEVLKEGLLFVPDFFKASGNHAADVILFFHGAAWCAEQTFYDAHKNAVLLTLNQTNLETLLQQPGYLAQVLQTMVAALKPEGVAQYNQLCLASFSGGYVAIRAILRQPEWMERVNDVVLADSLYAPRVKGNSNELDPEAMLPFLDFSRRATEGKISFVFSQLFPPEEKYRDNTTTLAAYYLTDKLKVERRPATGHNSSGAQLLYRADKGSFHVLGYAGMTNQDHFNHFYGWADLLRETSLADAP